jgi:hypothetical protein
VNEIFVFGSNQGGRHGKGSARTAKEKHDAAQGVGEGRTGRAYAIPTKDYQMRVRSLRAIKGSINLFVAYARRHPELKFNVVDIGCGLGGYRPDSIAALFPPSVPANVHFLGDLGRLVPVDYTGAP